MAFILAGVYTGLEAVHPFTGKLIPIYVADYVLIEYGTGAAMGVPAHDERDFAFARHHGIPMVRVIAPAGHDDNNQNGESSMFSLSTCVTISLARSKQSALPSSEYS